MCGIAGFVGHARSTEAAGTDLRRMCDAIAHRGPDDAGYYTAEGVALGMRRLSIIDLAGGHQPIANEDGSVRVVFNGEIYNYRELRRDLLQAGHELATHTDTETLVHLYEDRGEAMVDPLRGMFAFAVWDERRRRLLLVRDRLGIKPLYYWESGKGLAFASELKSLLTLRDFPREIDRGALADYLALGYVPDPKCIYRGVRKLPPGHLLSWEPGGRVQVRRYWSPFRPEDRTLDETTAAEEVRRLLSDSVRYRLIADVPLGAFLSGGVDSSAVVAEMSRQMDRPVKTFSIGFHEEEWNEAPDAARVARALGTDHTELIVTPDVEDLFEHVVAAFDEPFADASAIPTYLVSQLARRDVTVALSGDGGDELFGGYTRYDDLLRRSRPLPRALQVAIAAVVRRLPHGAHGRNRLLELTRGVEGRYAGMVAYPLAPENGGVASADIVAAGLDLDSLLHRWFEDLPDRDLLTRATFVDILSYLPGDILTKVDRMSMAVSLEARVPLLDHHLAEFASTLPAHLKSRDGTGKWIFREAVRSLVPESVLQKRKQGFGVPLRVWFQDELRGRIDELQAPDSPLYEYVDREAVQRVVREHLTGRRDHNGQIWRLLVLHLWMQQSAAVRPGVAASPQNLVLENA